MFKILNIFFEETVKGFAGIFIVATLGWLSYQGIALRKRVKNVVLELAKLLQNNHRQVNSDAQKVAEITDILKESFLVQNGFQSFSYSFLKVGRSILLLRKTDASIYPTQDVYIGYISVALVQIWRVSMFSRNPII